MPAVDVTIGKRNFQLVCSEGQEQHLQDLATDVTAKIDLLSKSMKSNNDVLLLAMSSLMIQDELNELKQNPSNDAIPSEATNQDVDAEIAAAIDSISEYIENIADRIEKV